jgi:phosphonopyruvate decarboxylase|tara:strand:+ start:555 stop:941 length:387 start_codon:yes stop_codon:yes gene_type:complete
MVEFKSLLDEGYNFFTGVPDSGLKYFINDIIESDIKHIVATNEGEAIGIAVGAELVGKKSCVYLQNSGLGNIINPLTSLCIPYDIHPLLVIGHRHTLPQHKVMGEVDDDLLKLIEYTNYIIVRGDNNV